MTTKLNKLIQKAENLTTEFKESKSKLYGGSDPKLIQDDVFTTTISLQEMSEQVMEVILSGGVFQNKTLIELITHIHYVLP